MDPDKALVDLSEALATGDNQSLIMSAIFLDGWLLNGGYEPNWSAHPQATRYFKEEYRTMGQEKP